MNEIRNDQFEKENSKDIGFISVSSLIKNFEEKANQAKKNQPSMGLRAYNLKFNPGKTEETIEPNFKELKEFNSDSRLQRVIENHELYDCLVKYESRQLYQDAACNLKPLSDEMHFNFDSHKADDQSDNNLIPFLDVPSQSFNPQPLFSSTVFDFDNDSSELKLPITPIRLVSNVSKLKKLRSFNLKDGRLFLKQLD